MGHAVNRDSRFIRELGRIASGQMKVLTTCCVANCPNEVAIVIPDELALADLKSGGKGHHYYKCPSHQHEQSMKN